MEVKVGLVGTNKGERVDRGTPLGNPFRISTNTTREEAIQLYRAWLWDKIGQRDKTVMRELFRLLELARRTGGVTLLCHCKPLACHADVIKSCLEWLDSPHKVIVCGSRDYEDEGFMQAVLEDLPPNTVIIHGNCNGADKMAGRIARQLGHSVIEYPAEWGRYGMQAGPIRNEKMLRREKPALVIAFPLPGSKGTWDMVNKAEQAGVPIAIHGSWEGEE